MRQASVFRGSSLTAVSARIKLLLIEATRVFPPFGGAHPIIIFVGDAAGRGGSKVLRLASRAARRVSQSRERSFP
jgi:hypothetical protein